MRSRTLIAAVSTFAAGVALTLSWSACRTASNGSGLADTESDNALAGAARAALERNCNGCHGPASQGEAGINYINDLGALVERGKVKRGSEQQQRASRILVRMKSADIPMPPLTDDQNNAITVRPTPQEIQAVEAWILANAPVPAVAEAPAFIPSSDILAAIRTDIEAVAAENPANAPFKRYFTVTHLRNTGATPQDLDATRLNVSRVLNSLSWNKRITAPFAFGPGNTIFRIDLRHYNWNATKWNALEAVDPYKPVAAQATAPDITRIKQLTATQDPIIRADFFVSATSRPPLYYTMLIPPGQAAFPSTDVQLQGILGVDVIANLTNSTSGLNGKRHAWRAGIPANESGVSINNRMIERHGIASGAYWRSYDFGPPNDPSKNLNDCPLGPKALQPASLMTCAPNRGFTQDGGEVIWNLPNGLQAYMLLNGAGQRIDQGPINIVFDDQSPARNFAGDQPGQIVNGISCMACHTEGPKVATDRILARVNAAGAPFTDAVKVTTNNLYSTQAELDTVFEEDKQTFLNALAKTGSGPSSADSIVGLIRQFEKTVDLKNAAAELGVTEAQLVEKRSALNQQTQVAMLDLFNGGVMQRKQWAALFPQVATQIATLIPQVTPTPTPQPSGSPTTGGSCPAEDVAFGGKCYYLDGATPLQPCDGGYALAPESILDQIGTAFTGKTYKHNVSDNCCVRHSEEGQVGGRHFGLPNNCNGTGPFSAGPTRGGSGCNGTTASPSSNQLTLCVRSVP